MSLCCCEKSVERQKHKPDYPLSAALKVIFDGKEYGINASFENDGEGELTFVSPSSLKGLKLAFGKDGATLNYCGVRIPIDTDYASKHGILMLRDIMTADRDGFSGAKMIKRSGVSYCRERYESDGFRIDVFFREGNDMPSFIEAEAKGRSIEIIFVNNQ